MEDRGLKMAKEPVAPSSVLDPPSSSLLRPVEDLDGVGPARARHLKELGVRTLGDLLEYFPRTYQLETGEKPISALLAGEQIQQARGVVVAVDYIPVRPRPRFEATLEDDDRRKLALCWFNSAWLRQSIHPGMMLRVQGKVRFRGGIPQMTQPKWEAIDEQAERIDQ